MHIPNYMYEVNKIKSSLKGKTGIIEVYHEGTFKNDLNGCHCNTALKIIAKDKLPDEQPLFGYRHIFKDRTIEPLDEIGQEYGAVIAYMPDGTPVLGNHTKG